MANTTKQDLERLSAHAHTHESFGRAITSGALAAAAASAAATASGRAIKLQLDVTITRIPRIGAYVCVGIEGFGRHWYGRGEHEVSSYDDASAVATLSTIWARGLGLALVLLRVRSQEDEQIPLHGRFGPALLCGQGRGAIPARLLQCLRLGRGHCGRRFDRHRAR